MFGVYEKQIDNFLKEGIYVNSYYANNHDAFGSKYH